MSLPLFFLILLILISLFCIGLVSLSRNIPLRVRLYFCVAITGVVQWVGSLYLSNVDSGLTLFFNRVVYLGPIIALLFLGLFIEAFYLKGGWRSKVANFISVALALPAAALTFTRFNVSSITPRIEGGVLTGYNVVPGVLNIFVAAVTVILAVMLFVRLFQAYKTTEQEKRRAQRLIFRSLVFAIAISMITNLLAPMLIGGSSLANTISNIATIIFTLSVAYGVLRYSFLDIRLLVVRSLAYIAGLVIILSAVAGLNAVLFGVLGGGNVLSGQQMILFFVLSAVAVMSFGPLRSLFTRLTSRYFFKNAYDPAVFISSFNNSLVNNVEIESLLRRSSDLISKTLNAEFCVIAIRETSNMPRFIIGTKELKVLPEDERIARGITARSNQKILVRQLLRRDNVANQQLSRIMGKYDVDAIVRLLAAGGPKERGIGYIILGPKKNGEIYNKTDTDVLVAIANALVLAVQNALRFEEISQFNAMLEERIDERTRELRSANIRLRKLDHTKDDFISMASHQLRTPLTSVKGYVSMVLDGDAGPISESQRKLLMQAFISSQRMVGLISDLLNVSRLKTGKFVIEPTECDLSKIVDEEVGQLQETVSGRGLELTYAKPEHFPVLMLDETKIRQVIMNFIDNAIYYTPSGGHIEVKLVEKPDSVEFTVIDDGIGVPRHEQHHLFTKFFRAHNARTARPDGTGLGLFMAKKVVVAQGGAILFKSTPGKGSTFGFTFPKAKLLPQAAPDPAKAATAKK